MVEQKKKQNKCPTSPPPPPNPHTPQQINKKLNLCTYDCWNKGPKRTHIVHLSTKCNLYWQVGQDGHLVFPIGLKKPNLVEDVEIFLPVKFCWIPFSGFKEKLDNISANQRPGWPSCFYDRPEKHKLGRGPWDLASCQVLMNSVQQLQRRSRKCLNQIEARAVILFFPDRPEKHKLGRGRWDLPSCYVSLNSAQRFQRRIQRCFGQSEARAAVLFFRSAPKTQTWQTTLRSCFLSSFVEFFSAVSEEKSKMHQPIRGQGGHRVFPIGPKNTNLVEDVEILSTSCQVSLNSI